MGNGNAAERGPVSARVCGEDRCFKSWNKSLVTVGSGVGEGQDGIGVLNDSPNEVESHVAQSRGTVSSEQVLARRIMK
jgi:hypothetical protein